MKRSTTPPPRFVPSGGLHPPGRLGLPEGSPSPGREVREASLRPLLALPGAPHASAHPASPLAPRRAPAAACVHCGDPVRASECPTCGESDSRSCPECHAEVRHGSIVAPWSVRE